LHFNVRKEELANKAEKTLKMS